MVKASACRDQIHNVATGKTPAGLAVDREQYALVNPVTGQQENQLP